MELRIPIFYCKRSDQMINGVLTKMNFAEMRTSQHLTKKKLSEMTGLSVKCIADIESATSGNPTFNSIMKYVTALGYEIDFVKKT